MSKRGRLPTQRARRTPGLRVKTVNADRLQRAAGLALLLAGTVSGALEAVTCGVPTGTYPTISAAVAAPACTAIVVAAGSYLENVVVSRTLTVSFAGSTSTYVKGSFRVEGATSVVALNDLRVDGTAAGVSGCWANILQVSGGARLTVDPSVGVIASRTASTCRFFVDGFEWGTVNSWSSSSP